MTTDLAALVLSALLSVSPLTSPHESLPGWSETTEERAGRYESIAHDIATVAALACERSADPSSCAFSAAAALVGVAHHESDLAPDVDAGRCYRGRDGKGPRCDSGRAVSVFQVQPGGGEEGALVRSSRQEAARFALRHIWRSLGACRKMAPELRMSAYAGGRCTDAGRPAAASRELWASIAAARFAMRRAAK